MSFKSQFNTLKYVPYYFTIVSTTVQIDFCEQASYIRGPQTNCTDSQRSMGARKMDHLNQEFTVHSGEPINVCSRICFYLNRVGNGNDDISSEMQFENLKPGDVLIFY